MQQICNALKYVCVIYPKSYCLKYETNNFSLSISLSTCFPRTWDSFTGTPFRPVHLQTCLLTISLPLRLGTSCQLTHRHPTPISTLKLSNSGSGKFLAFLNHYS